MAKELGLFNNLISRELETYPSVVAGADTRFGEIDVLTGIRLTRRFAMTGYQQLQVNVFGMALV